jgi:SAM-dependent methyltransferase
MWPMHTADQQSALLLTDGALAAVPDEVWRQLADRLDALGIDEDKLRSFDFLGPEVGDPLRLPLQQWKARAEGSVAALGVACLRLQEAVSEQEVNHLFGNELATEMIRRGLLVQVADEQFGFALRLGALEGKFILSDPNLFHPDSVMGSSAATSRIYVAAAIDSAPWPDDGSLLDLGCGGGALALALAPLARQVYGYDISARAVDLAHVNAVLNRLDLAEQHIEFQRSDLFDGFAGCRFSRIVCQPPFIPDIGDGATFASGGALGDAVTLRVLRQLGQHLSARGRAVLCVEWAVSEAERWQDRVQDALNGQGLIGIHCELFRTPAEDYCTLLSAYLHPVGSAGYGEFLKRMLAHYRQQGIHAIDLVLHFVEVAGEAPELHAVRQVPLTSLDHVTAGYADRALAALRLSGAENDALLRAAPQPPEGFAVAEEDPDGDGFLEVAFAPESLLPSGRLPMQAVDVLQAAVESVSVDEMLERLAGEPAEALLLIRQMLAQGLLFAD